MNINVMRLRKELYYSDRLVKKNWTQSPDQVKDKILQYAELTDKTFRSQPRF